MSQYSHHLKNDFMQLKQENQELKEEVVVLREYLSALHALLDAIEDLDPASEIMPLLDRILANGMAVTNAQDGSLLVLDEETNELVFVLARGRVAPPMLIGQRVPPGRGIAGWVAQKGQPTIVNNAHADIRFYPGIDDAFKFQTNSVLAVPIVSQGQVLGVIEVLNKHNGRIFDPADQALLTLLCRFAGDVLHSMMLQEEQTTAPDEQSTMVESS
ncbi:MAG: GAF domain-containing protein [Anaerolineae bacterium]|nr:GAF domain-containing protein [Anaerolineae bacterium]